MKKIDCFCVGGGGGGQWEGGGSGGGYTTTKLAQSVTPGSTIPIVVGAGGIASAYWFSSGWKFTEASNGSASSIGSICSANGGTYNFSHGCYGGNGGSGGGGCGGFNGGAKSAGNGGSDGSDGGKGIFSGGTGQHSTTRYFGESNGTLYAGGGGGGEGIVGAGGAGGGGNGGGYGGWSNFGTGGAGSPNTGGGGGGATEDIGNRRAYGGSGGSGVCIIRWAK